MHHSTSEAVRLWLCLGCGCDTTLPVRRKGHSPHLASASACLSTRARALACASTTVPVGFDVRPDRVVNGDLLSNGGGSLVGDLLVGDRLLGDRPIARSIDTPLGVVGLAAVNALVIPANSGNIAHSGGGRVVLFLFASNIR